MIKPANHEGITHMNFVFKALEMIMVTYKSLEEYCFDIAERSLSRAPDPPRAVSKVGLAAVVIFDVY